MDILKSLWADMRSKGFSVDFEKVKTNGEYTRFSRDSSGLNAFVKVDFFPEQNYASAHFGDWRTNESYNWASTQDSEMTPEESEKLLAAIEERNAAQEVERKKRAEDAATSAKYLFESLPEGGENKYLFKKGLKSPSLYGARAGANGELYIPAYSGGEIVGLQKILPDGTKMFQPGMKVRGSYFSMQGKAENRRIFVCEGFATAASIWEAFEGNETVVAAFNSGNLSSVVAHFRETHPNHQLIVCGDEDILTKVSGEWHNSGRLAALGAGADAVCFPNYTKVREFYGSDFNDMHQALILELVAEAIEEQILSGPYPEPVYLRPVQPEPKESDSGAGPGPESEPSPVPRAGGRIPAAPRGKDKNGKSVKPSQQFVASFVLDFHGKNLVKCERDVFQWVGTHWKLCGERELDSLYNQCKQAAGPDFKAGEVDAIFRLLLKSIPHIPSDVSMYDPRPDRANFQNGTLHVFFRPKTKEEMGEAPGAGAYHFSLDFKPHDRADLCINVLPMEYKPAKDLQTNAEFESMCRNLWPDTDPEQASKVRLYKQIMGAALVPMFPKIFFFLGRPKTGKSTALEIIERLLDKSNVTDSDPSNWGKEFYLSPMAGKLANIHTDISITKMIDESAVKRIIDRRPIQMNRKGRDHIRALLPAMHLFGANDMPGSTDANSGAFDRRIIIVKTDTVQPGEGGGGEMSGWIWGRGPEGILKAALEGLEDLLKNGGRFTEPESSKGEKQKWGNASDFVGQFIEACRTGEFKAANNVTIIVDRNAKIMSSSLYALYSEWMKKEDLHHHLRGGAFFGRDMAKRSDITRRLTKRGTEFHGIGLSGGGSGAGVVGEKNALPPLENFQATENNSQF